MIGNCPAEGDRFNGRVFISDLHGQKDVLDYLTSQDFGLIKQLTENICAGHYSTYVQKDLERLLVNARAGREVCSDHCDREPVTAEVIKALMEVLVLFKNERAFSLACMNHLTNCGWMLARLDQLAMGDPLDDHFLYELSSLESFDRSALASYIARATIELLEYRINVVGDIYDRGADAFFIMEDLAARKNVHIQWGNHDVVWLGAAAGSLACIATVVRICLRYGTLATLESHYEIDLSVLEELAETEYANDDCLQFAVGSSEETARQKREPSLLAKMHKAIAIIQFKLEDQLLERNSHFRMGERRLLHNIDTKAGVIKLGEANIPLEDKLFPTLDEASPAAMSDEEWSTIEELRDGFVGCERLSSHMEYLLANGGMYESDGWYLMFHGCVPLNDDGSLKGLDVAGANVTGRPLFNALELQLRKAYSRRHSNQCQYLSDVAWYLWCGPASPLFGKEKMTTFERYFMADKQHHKEGKNRYFIERNKPEFINFLTEEFGGPDGGIVVNGHVPVKVSSGESPIMAEGRMICIDGGFARPYRNVTGISGLTLVHGCGEATLYGVEECEEGFRLFDVERSIYRPDRRLANE